MFHTVFIHQSVLLRHREFRIFCFSKVNENRDGSFSWHTMNENHIFNLCSNWYIVISFILHLTEFLFLSRDNSLPVLLVQKYLAKKLDLVNETEVSDLLILLEFP